MSILITPFAYGANEYTTTSSSILDPSISKRCDALIAKRQKHISHRQRVSGLLFRCQYLINNTPTAKITIKTRLRQAESRLDKELVLSSAKIQNLTEEIIRKGCPNTRFSVSDISDGRNQNTNDNQNTQNEE